MADYQSSTLMVNIYVESAKKSSAAIGDLVVIAQVVANGIAKYVNMDIVSFSAVQGPAILATVVYVHHGHTTEEIVTIAGGITPDPRTPNHWSVAKIIAGPIPYIEVSVS